TMAWVARRILDVEWVPSLLGVNASFQGGGCLPAWGSWPTVGLLARGFSCQAPALPGGAAAEPLRSRSTASWRSCIEDRLCTRRARRSVEECTCLAGHWSRRRSPSCRQLSATRVALRHDPTPSRGQN